VNTLLIRLLFVFLAVFLVTPRSTYAATTQACRLACTERIDDCLRTCGQFGKLGRFERSCRRAVLQRCRREGIQVCHGEPVLNLAAPTTGHAVKARATKRECRPACGEVVDDCIRACGQYGALRKFAQGCRRAVLSRCRREGIQVCSGRAAQEAPATPGATTTTLVGAQNCFSSFPVCNGVCPRGTVCRGTAGACLCVAGIVLPGSSTTTLPSVTTTTTLGQLLSCFSSAPLCNGQCPRGTACRDVNGACLCTAGVATPIGATTSTTTSSTTTTTFPLVSQPLHCFDDIQNADETDVDCGGAVCVAGCGLDEGCLSSRDCATGLVCSAGRCVTDERCFDGIQNQDETDVDCGGDICVARCTGSQKCQFESDCDEGFGCFRLESQFVGQCTGLLQ
jgi:hypothetical protein